MNNEEKASASCGVIVLVMATFITAVILLDDGNPELNTDPIRSFALDLCERHPEDSEYFSQAPVTLFEKPFGSMAQMPSVIGQVPSCAGVKVHVMAEKVQYNQDWLLVESKGFRGWQTKKLLEL